MEIVRTATYARNIKRLGKLGATEADVIAMETPPTPRRARSSRAPAGDLVRLRRIGQEHRLTCNANDGDEVVYLMAIDAKAANTDPDQIKLFKTRS